MHIRNAPLATYAPGVTHALSPLMPYAPLYPMPPHALNPLPYAPLRPLPRDHTWDAPGSIG